MKKKLILTISLIAMLLCAFAFCVSAEEITVNTITSDTYGTVYQLSKDPGLDGAEAYKSELKTIVDSGTEQETLSILTDGTYYYVFPTSYIIAEFLSGQKGKFEYRVSDVNTVFSAWNEAEGTTLPQFELTGSWGNTRIDALVRIEFSKDVLWFDRQHCLVRSTNLKEAIMHDDIYFNSNSTSIFYGCTALETVRFSTKYTNVPGGTFSGCTNFKGISNWNDIKDSITSIGKEAFYNCTSLTSLDVSTSSATSVGDHAFYGCSNLATLNLPSTVTSIGKAAFRGCSSLANFDVPDSLVTLGAEAFHSCKALTRLEFPPTTTSFGQDCFNTCTSLEYINIPRDCTSIGNYTFSGCSKVLIDLSGAKSLTSTGTNNNWGVTTSLVFPEGFKTCAGISSGNVTSIVFPNSTTSVGVLQCGALTEIVMPAGLTSLVNKQFDYCGSLTKVTIPAGCTSIATTGNTSFYGTTKNNLKTIVFTGSADAEVLESIKTLLPNATIEFANHCEVYYEGEHIEGNPTVSFVGEEFLSVAQLCDDCTRCTKTVVLKEVAPLFTSKGWTYSLDGAELSQGFKIEKENIDFYNEHFGIVGFGVVGAIHTYFDKDGNEQTYTENSAFISVVDGKVVTTGAVAAGFENSDYSIFAMKMTGLTGDNQKAKIYLSAYVATADNVYYLSNNQASVDAATDSTSIYALLQKEETVE